VYLLSRGRGEGLSQTFYKVNSGKSSHQLLMVEHRKGEEVEAWLLEMEKYF
jgi:hypothetical protein